MLMLTHAVTSDVNLEFAADIRDGLSKQQKELPSKYLYDEVGSRLLGGGIDRIRLTATGQHFVQPELAEFGQDPMLPRVVQSIEKEILTYPEQSRGAFLFKLRESIAQNSPELVAKLLVEVLPRMLNQAG